VQDQTQPAPLDGEIYVYGATPPLPPAADPEDTLAEREWGTGVAYRLPENTRSGETTLYERVLLRTKDPTTLPKTRSVCAKWAKPWPGSKICVGWKLQYKWFWVTATLRVTTTVPTDIGKVVEECLKEAAVIAAITAIVTGGSAAAAAAEKALEACLLRKLADKLLNVSVVLSHNWDQNWG